MVAMGKIPRTLGFVGAGYVVFHNTRLATAPFDQNMPLSVDYYRIGSRMIPRPLNNIVKRRGVTAGLAVLSQLTQAFLGNGQNNIFLSCYKEGV